MSNKLQKLLFQPLQLIIGFWILLWVLPWATWLESLPWLRLGLAILSFIIPGSFISMYLVGHRFTLISHFISGFAISILLVGFLGVLGRIGHWPFGYIKPTFVVLGMAVSLMLGFQARTVEQLYKQKNISIKTLILLVIIMILGILIAFWDRIGLDERVYLAYLTSWQHSPRLDFTEVIFNSGNLDRIRFWFAMFPMNVAFLSEISGLHGLLLLGYYLGPVFVTIAILSTYSLYDELLQLEKHSIIALIIQFTFLFLLLKLRQTGNMFFFRITEDKSFAAFILTPVFFLAVRILLQSKSIRTAIFVLFTGWSLALTHPIILSYAVFIAGVYAGFVTVKEKDIKKLAVTVVLFTAIMMPVASLRFVDVPWISRYVFGLNTPLKQPGAFDLESALDASDIGSRISYIKDTPYYGFNLSLIRIQTGTEGNPILGLLSWAYLWILGFGFIWSLTNLKKHPVAPFIAATSLLVLLCAIPYTGWLIGKFVTARMLWRAPWLFPVGLSTVVLVDELMNILLKKVGKKSNNMSKEVFFSLSLIICSILIAYHSTNTYGERWQKLTQLAQYKNSLSRLSKLGDYLEANIEQPSRFIAAQKLMDYLPGLSSKSRIIFFRNDIRTPNPPDMNEARLVLSESNEVSLEQRVDLCMEYDIRYLVTEDDTVKDYYSAFPEHFNVQEAGEYWIIELLKAD